MKIQIAGAFLLGVLVWCTWSSYANEDVQFDSANVTVGNKTLKVEFAKSFEQRAQGLMFRRSLCDDCGMLFLFKPEKVASMWMKNTYIPLDVAFIDSDGVITDIKALEPHDLTSVGASVAVRYALEMNQGWFAKHDIKEGDSLRVTPEPQS